MLRVSFLLNTMPSVWSMIFFSICDERGFSHQRKVPNNVKNTRRVQDPPQTEKRGKTPLIDGCVLVERMAYFL
jgi:hypothetical protein